MTPMPKNQDGWFAAEAAPTTAVPGVGAPSGANRQRFHGRDLRRGRHSCANQVYLVTTVTHERESLFAHSMAAREVVHALRHASEHGLATTHAYVVMPDHLHWLLGLGGGHELSSVVARVKGKSARRINLLLEREGRPVWQAGFHDHAIRTEEDIRHIARYIVANPLRGGLMHRVGDYPWWDAEWL